MNGLTGETLAVRWPISVCRVSNSHQEYRRLGIVVLADVRELHAALSVLLRRELDAGNLVDDTWRGWPTPSTICVKLARSFMPKTLEAATESLVYSAVDDPHYWREEILHKPSGHLLITGFDQFEPRNVAT